MAQQQQQCDKKNCGSFSKYENDNGIAEIEDRIEGGGGRRHTNTLTKTVTKRQDDGTNATTMCLEQEGKEDSRSSFMLKQLVSASIKDSIFSEVDLKILKSLLQTKGRISSVKLSRELDIPLTTVQRRRKRLENEFLTMQYSIRPDKLSLRYGYLLISTSAAGSSSPSPSSSPSTSTSGSSNSGSTNNHIHRHQSPMVSPAYIGRQLLLLPEIKNVTRTVGDHISLFAEISFRDNKQLIDIIDKVKIIEGVSDIMWIEAVEKVQ
jgi:DNA-binding Lrp family transcriptional regulator